MQIPDSTNPKDIIGQLKPQLHLVPPALKIQVARAMENGAKKFGAYNWRDKKVRATVYIAAAMRHLEALLDGENNAADSGVHHAAHAAACLGIYLDAEAGGQLIDDRPPKGPASELIHKFTKQKEVVGAPIIVPIPAPRSVPMPMPEGEPFPLPDFAPTCAPVNPPYQTQTIASPINT